MKTPLILITLASVTLLIFSWGISSHADNDESYESTHNDNLSAVKNDLYVAECASCHMAYPPGLLPTRSWQKMMTTLNKHFGEDASLDAASVTELTRYLTDNSHTTARYTQRMQRNLPADQTPLRITELDYFKHHHAELPPRLHRDNPKVGSLSNCIACHSNAEKASFREREINIPGYGRWDD